MTLSEIFLRNRFKKGAAEGRASQHSSWKQWDDRRREAEKLGREFTEPPPELPSGQSPNVEVFLNDSANGEVMSTNQLEARIAIWEREGRSVKLWAHEDERAGFSMSVPRFRVTVDPAPSIAKVLGGMDMTDKQYGWKEGINLVFDQFGLATWQEGLGQKRKQAATEIEERLKMQEESPFYQSTMEPVVVPFITWLKGEPLPSPPFDTALPEKEGRAMDEALEIVLCAFKSFVRGRGPEPGWTWSEMADDLEKLVQYEGRERSQDFRRAMADVIRPFFKVLKGKPKSGPEQ